MPQFFLNENKQKFGLTQGTLPTEVYIALNLGRTSRPQNEAQGRYIDERPNESVALSAWINYANLAGILDPTITITSTTASTITVPTTSTHELIYLVDATAGVATVNLPPAATWGSAKIIVKKIDSSVNAVTLDGNAAETIDGTATYSMTTQDDAVTVISDGTQWHIVSSHDGAGS